MEWYPYFMNTEKFENLRFEQSNDTAILTFNGDLTTEDCDRLRSALMRAIENSNRVVVNFERAINVDSICLQILCMARRISRRLKKFMILTGKSTAVVRQRLESNSCSCFLDCAFLNNKSCILSEVTKEYGLQTVPKI
jgi:anti-anti-sigma regulatory factor